MASYQTLEEAAISKTIVKVWAGITGFSVYILLIVSIINIPKNNLIGISSLIVLIIIILIYRHFYNKLHTFTHEGILTIGKEKLEYYHINGTTVSFAFEKLYRIYYYPDRHEKNIWTMYPAIRSYALTLISIDNKKTIIHVEKTPLNKFNKELPLFLEELRSLNHEYYKMIRNSIFYD